METAYATAIQKQLRLGVPEQELVSALVAQLKAKGRLKLLPAIRRELIRLMNQEQKPLVEVAHKDDSTEALKQASLAGITATHATVNPSLIRGWRAREGSQLVDRSGKRALVDLYRRITA